MDEQVVEIAAQTATNLIKDSLSSMYSPISEILTVKRAQFFEGFSSYCNLIHEKNSLVRTLYSKNKPVPLNEVYVRTRFHQGSNTFTDNDLINNFAAGRRVIVKGNGGSGKTIFLKHLWLSRFEKPEGKIPIFVELRRLNDLQSIDISTFCRNELQSDLSFGKGVFEKLCEAGKFEFIFDGFDEVNRENRKNVEQQIIALSETYRECCFLVSGREDDRFSSWGNFETFSVSPLTLDDAKELIKKIPFDRKVKKKFLEILKEDFYRQHNSFLSSPLLAVMMLMTFNENAIIPSKLTEFYKSAFQTLLTWHDATKDSFERDRALSVDDFRKVFSTFCLITYYEQVYEFDEDIFRRYIGKALKYHSIEIGLEEVKNDICESANLLQKDGLKFIFVHRSFQEYFAAECAMQVVSGKAKDFLEVFSKRTRDTVFAMCYEIHPELVFDQYFSDKVDWIIETGYLVPIGPKRTANPWMCEAISVECVNHNESGVHATRASIRSDEHQQDFLRVVDLCSQVTSTDLGKGPMAAMFGAVFQSVEASSDVLPRGNTQELRIVVSFDGDKQKVSIRNTGPEKFCATKMRSFRSRFLSELSEKLKISRKNMRQYYLKAQDMFDQLKEERMAKEKSIDDILGV
ncbi:NACHT domain-containing protein [Roseibium alexandrii]